MSNMKEYFLENKWAILWFVAGVIFLVFAFIAEFNHENEKSIACVAICLACHGRSEVKILQKKMEKHGID